jgi:hypothetical protein
MPQNFEPLLWDQLAEQLPDVEIAEKNVVELSPPADEEVE